MTLTIGKNANDKKGKSHKLKAPLHRYDRRIKNAMRERRPQEGVKPKVMENITETPIQARMTCF